jgi:two-component system, chemotaxis family, CheB/CheR fusion protein
LETSREELQSINEELATVNSELKNNVDELGRTNADLSNLMAATGVATLFLDRTLGITRYTPSAVDLFRLIPSDLGRPLMDLNHRLKYPDLKADAEQVLKTLIRIHREVTDGQRWFLAQLLPYRTAEDHIAGVVLSFVDITEPRKSREALKESEERLQLIIESAKDYAIFTTDLQRNVVSWNAGAQTMFGYEVEGILGKSADILFVPEDRASGAPVWEAETALSQGRAETERWHLRKSGSRFYGSGLVMPLRGHDRKVIGLVKIMRDRTESKQAEDEIRQRNEELERFNKAAVDREVRMVELKKEVNQLTQELGKRPRYEIPGTDSFHPSGQ